MGTSDRLVIASGIVGISVVGLLVAVVALFLLRRKGRPSSDNGHEMSHERETPHRDVSDDVTLGFQERDQLSGNGTDIRWGRWLKGSNISEEEEGFL
jgi:hypothetical protein